MDVSTLRVVLRIILTAFFFPIDGDEGGNKCNNEQLLIRGVYRDFQNPRKVFMGLQIVPYL